MRNWWDERLPMKGETHMEASERLWNSPEYAGSLEDACFAVADAMALERERQHWLQSNHDDQGGAA